MATRIEERFTVKASPPAVWSYLIDPRRVVRCLPGAELTEVVDERTFHGNVKVKVGPVQVAYKGRVQIVELDQTGGRVRMAGDGRESTGAGAAKMSMESRVVALPGGETEVTVLADVEIAGRLVQLGRGMIEQVSHQIFEQFATCVRATLEAEATPAAAGATGTAPAAPPAEDARPVPLIGLLFRALWAWIRMLLGGGKR